MRIAASYKTKWLHEKLEAGEQEAERLPHMFVTTLTLEAFNPREPAQKAM